MAFVFTDSKNRRWDVSLNLAAAKRIDNSNFDSVTKLRDFSFLNPDKNLLAEIVNNKQLLVAMIWAVVHTAAAKQLDLEETATPEDAEIAFLEGFDGATLDLARDAFIGAMSDFFREHKTVLSTLIQQRNAGIAKLNAKLAEVQDQARQFIEAEVEMEIQPLVEALKSGDREAVKALLSSR